MPDQLIVITGPRGVGKSTLAATFNKPTELNRVYVHDSENSMNNIRAELERLKLDFGRYVSLKDRFRNLPDDNDLLTQIESGKLPWVSKEQKRSLEGYYRFILSDLEKHLEHGAFDVYVHDTIEKLEAGMAAWVESHKRAAGVSSTAYGRLWNDGVFPLYEQLLSALYARGVKTVILTSHLKNPWVDKRPVVGKVVPSGKKLLYRLSALMIWLVNDAANIDGAPAGLILKERMGRLEVDEESGEWRAMRVLPQRVPHCTWHDIRLYNAVPCSLKDPKPRELMSEQERDMISELLTDEQMRLMILGAEQELLETKAASAPILTGGENKFDFGKEMAKQRALDLFAANEGAEQIAETLDKPLPLVKRWLGE